METNEQAETQTAQTGLVETTNTGTESAFAPDGGAPDGQKAEGSLLKDTSWTLDAKAYPEIHEDFLTGFATLAKEAGLGSEGANRMLKSALELAQKSERAEYEKNTADWLEMSRNDKVVGGARFTDNIRQANRAMDVYGSPGLRALLDETGLGNHPLIVRLFYNLSKTLKEDGIVKGTAMTGGNSLANRMFPNMN